MYESARFEHKPNRLTRPFLLFEDQVVPYILRNNERNLCMRVQDLNINQIG